MFCSFSTSFKLTHIFVVMPLTAQTIPVLKESTIVNA